jgi:hypothetical protein
MKLPDEIVRHMLAPALAGSLAGLVATAGLLALNVGSLRTLIAGAERGWIAVALLAAGFMITFGSAAIGAAIMSLGEDSDC